MFLLSYHYRIRKPNNLRTLVSVSWGKYTWYRESTSRSGNGRASATSFSDSKKSFLPWSYSQSRLRDGQYKRMNV